MTRISEAFRLSVVRKKAEELIIRWKVGHELELGVCSGLWG